MERLLAETREFLERQMAVSTATAKV